MLGLGTSIPKVESVLDTTIPPTRSLVLDGVGDMATFTETSFTISDSGDFLSIAFWALRTDNHDAAWVFGNTSTADLKRINFATGGESLQIEGDRDGELVTGEVTASTDWNFYVINIQGNDNAESTVVIYENGATVTIDNTNFGVTSLPITLNVMGASGADGSNANEFKGSLYNVGIWRKILDDNSIEHLNAFPNTALTGNVGGYTSSGSLIHYWRFEDVNDTVGDLELTLVGNASFETTIPS